ncbi:MAG: rhodanese-like domain-containing protein [Nanoarchaeota archaeon]|nr:rhodanese-like domain-containing protein [Nanoarchaeota archaeon]
MERGYWWGIIVFVVVLAFGVIYYSPPVGQTIIEVGESVIVSGYMDISSIDAQELIANNPDLIIIDVSPNYEQGHLPNAVNYYIGDGSLDAAISNLDPKVKYLVYCHFASASRAGAQKLVDAGFTNVYRLEDNYGGWVMRGYPIEY